MAYDRIRLEERNAPRHLFAEETWDQIEERKHQADLQRLRGFRSIDDDFMRCMFRDNKPLVEFVLRILLGKDQLELISCETQVDLKRITGARSVVLDALAKDKPGMKLELFWSIRNAIRSKAGWAAWGLLIGNACFFIPLGFMLSYLHPGMERNRVWI